MGACASSAQASPEEMKGLVGDAVRVEQPGVNPNGEHGYQEVIEQGKPMTYETHNGQQICCGMLCVFVQWPLSSIAFGINLGLQLIAAPLCYNCLGNEWCMSPSQISYTHALYVAYNTLRTGWRAICCCCCNAVQPGLLFGTLILPMPPRFIFDEEKNIPFLVPFETYVKTKAATFPPFSGRYRAYDGGGNNANYPFLGQGGRGYAMDEPFMILPSSAMPDPDAMQRDLQFRTTFKAAPWGQNAIACWFANVAIHEFFRTASGDDAKYTGGVEKPWVNLHSGYLDLQTLYGFNKEIADGARSHTGGKMAKYAETRFEGRIPESAVILELLRREHNYVCDQLVAKYPDRFKTDEEIYQQARLIMGGVFINIVIREYGDQVFGENPPDGGKFSELRQTNYGCFPRGISGLHNQTAGNHSSFNFNVIYRWHCAIPSQWDPAKIPPMKTDDDIRKIISDAYKWQSGGFGPNNVPAGLFFGPTSVSAADVKKGRQMGIPRLNDYRRRIFAAYTSFEDLTGNAELAKKLAKYYPTVEDVELSVGVQIERAMMGGWNLGETCGYTILFDAFNAIRQDRFYTTDFTPDNYTPWGYEHATSVVLVDLLNRHLNMGLDRNIMAARTPDWKGPPRWSELRGWPNPSSGFDERGNPILA